MGNGVNGMQSIAAAVTFHAYFAAGQRLTLDDSTDTIGRTTSLTASGIDYTVGGLATALITFRDFGNFRVFEGSGNDSFALSAPVIFGMTVQGNAGNDTITWNAFNNWSEYIGGTSTYPVMLDGSGGFNTLSVNDAARGNTSYQFYADRFYSTEPGLSPRVWTSTMTT